MKQITQYDEETPGEERVGGGAWWATRGAAVAAWAIAGWPVWRWYAARLGDGSDEPWGLVALVPALAFVPWRRLGGPVTGRAALLAGGAAVAVILGYDVLPALVRAALWMVALAAILGKTGPMLARSGLLLLSLPVVATAQFYLGYPLRALTAACSVPVLQGLGYAVAREGTALRWAGETVLVDAPCSGIQMLWTGLLAACLLAGGRGLGATATLGLLRWAGLAVATANVLRCVALFLVEVRGGAAGGWWHDAVGLTCFGGALGMVAWRAGRLGGRAGAGESEGAKGRRGVGRIGGAAWAIPALGVLLLVATVRPLIRRDGRSEATVDAAFPGWPETFEGRSLTALAPSAREARFAAGFPGRVAAFSDGERTIVLRWVARETRKLHPALHCLRGLGFAVQPGPVWREGPGRTWGTTVARREDRSWKVRERISDGAGGEWTDVSAWWWDAWRGRSVGPWWATTVFED